MITWIEFSSAFVAPCLYLFSMYDAVQIILEALLPPIWTSSVMTVIQYFLTIVTFILLLLCLTKKSNVSKKSYKCISVSLGYFHVFIVGFGIVITVQTVRSINWLYVL